MTTAHSAPPVPARTPAQERCDRLLEEANGALHDRRMDDAEPLLAGAADAAEECPRTDPRRAVVRHHAGILLGMQSKMEDAAAAFREAVAAWEVAVGPDDPHVCSSLNALGQVLSILERPADSLAQFERCLTIWEAKRGPAHPVVATTLHNVGTQLQSLGRHEEAISRFERAIRIDEDARGPEHPALADTLDTLAFSLAHLGRETVALAVSSRAAAIRAANAPQGGGCCGGGCSAPHPTGG